MPYVLLNFPLFLALVSGDNTFASGQNGKYYKVLTPAASYPTQKALCSGYGAEYHLAVVLSQSDYDAVMGFVNGDSD